MTEEMCVTAVKPTAAQMTDMQFAWRIVKHVKSNAIVVVKDGATLGVGAGQMNRVGSAKIALEEAKCFAKPILTTDFTTVRDQIADGATGCIARIDAADIAEKLRRLLTDADLRARLSENLRDYGGNLGEIERFYAMVEP